MIGDCPPHGPCSVNYSDPDEDGCVTVTATCEWCGEVVSVSVICPEEDEE